MVRLRAASALAAAAVLLAATPTAVASPSTGAAVVFHLQDPRLDEASGLAVGVRSPGIVYVQNDSGDTDRVFALDAATGATAAVVTITGARNVDWEDLAVAPDVAGMPSLWVADIGDNDARRREVDVYRVDEPTVDPDARGRTIVTARADEWRLRYPDGATDAESFAVTPGGAGYIVTKSLFGQSEVYRLPADPDRARVQGLARVGRIGFGVTGTPNPFGQLGDLTATGAAISPDGRLLAVRTYADTYLWRLGAGGIAAALTRRPVRLALPDQPQGEGIAFDHGRLLVDSEGTGTAVYALPLPRLPPRTGSSATPAPSAAPSSAGLSPAAPSSAGPVRTGHGGAGVDRSATAVFVAAVALIGGACGANRLRVRRSRRSG